MDMESEIKNENLAQDDAEHDDFQSIKYKIGDVDVDYYSKAHLLVDLTNTHKNIIEQLQNARKAKNITQSKLAELSNMPQQTISRIESNIGSPTLENILLYTYYIGYELRLFKKDLVTDELKKTWEMMLQNKLIEKELEDERKRIAYEMIKIGILRERIIKITQLDDTVLQALYFRRNDEIMEKNVNQAKEMIIDGIAIELIAKYTKLDIDILRDIQKSVEQEMQNPNIL